MILCDQRSNVEGIHKPVRTCVVWVLPEHEIQETVWWNEGQLTAE